MTLTGNDIPDSYVVMIEMKDNTFKALTGKLNVREAREKLEIVHLHMKETGDKCGFIRAFIFNLKEMI